MSTTATLSAASTSGLVGVASAAFTITLDSPTLTALSFPITYAGGSITTSPVVIGIGQTTGTFTVTPSSSGANNVSLGAGTTGLGIDGSPIAYTATIESLVVDNTYGAALTNEVVFIPVSAATFPFGQVDSGGLQLSVLNTDGATRITSSLRDWGANVGLAPGPVWLGPSTDGTSTYTVAGQVFVGPLGTANDPHTVWAVGSSDTTKSLVLCYDNTGSQIWTFQSATNKDYCMSAKMGDVNGDGVNEVALGFRLADSILYVLHPDGSQLWNWTAPSSMYLRGLAIGNMVPADLPGNEVFIGSSTGLATLLNPAGSQIWQITLTPTTGYFSTIQDALIDDLANVGTQFLYCSQGNLLWKIDSTGAIIWTYTHAGEISGLPLYSYQIASGHVTSTSTRQIVLPFDAKLTCNLGGVACISSTGTLLWERILPFPNDTICCGDVNGDGYDEVITGWGGNPANFPVSEGGILVLDRNGNEIGAAQLPGPARIIRCVPYDTTGRLGIVVTTGARTLHHFAVQTAPATGATVKAVIPSIGAGATKTIYLANAGSTINPPLGDYLFDLSGSNGTSPPGGTAHGGTWTIQGSWLQSEDDADTAVVASLEYAAVSTDGFELEFDLQKPGQGTGASTDYYGGVFFRANTWASNYPNGYELLVGAKGNWGFYPVVSGTGRGGNIWSTASAPTFNTTDTMRVRVVVTGADLTCAYSKNSGAWTVLGRIQDSTTLTAGTIAFVNLRGQSRYQNIVIRTIPSAYSTGGVGLGSSVAMNLLTPITYPASMMLGL